MEESKGASNSELSSRFWRWRVYRLMLGLDERLLAAARADNEDLLLEIFSEGKFDINCQDG